MNSGGSTAVVSPAHEWASIALATLEQDDLVPQRLTSLLCIHSLQEMNAQEVTC